jgi:hypothetical protein
VRRVRIPIGAALMAAALAGCSEMSAPGELPEPVVGQPGPQAAQMPTGAAEAMKNSLNTKLKGSRMVRRSPPSQVPH